MKFTLMLWLVFSASLALGSVGEPSLKANFDELYIMVMDNPSKMKGWASQMLSDPKSRLEPAHRSLLIATYAAACSEIRCPDEDPWHKVDLLDEALATARTMNDTDLLIRLEIYKLHRRLQSLEAHQAEEEYERIRKLAEERGSLRMQAEVYREMSALVERDNDLTKALKRIQMAIQLAQQGGYPGDLVPIIIQHDAALHFRRVGDTQRAMELYDYALKQLREKNIRHFLGTLTVNMARSKMGTSDPKQLDEAAALLQNAQDLVKGMDEPEALAYILLSRGDIAYKKSQFEPALVHFEAALKAYEKLGLTIWIGDVLHWKAKTLFKLQRYDESLRSIAASREKFPKSFKSDHYRLSLLQAEVLQKMGKFESGMSTLLELIKFKEEIEKESRENELNKLRVQLHVQVKEHQNEILTQENRQKEKELKQAEKIRLAAIFLSILSSIVLALLLFSHRQTRRLRRAQGKIQKILDNIDEGIITIGRRSVVETSLSSYIYDLIQFDSKRSRDVLQYLIDKAEIHADEKQMVWNTLQSSIGENQLTWEINRSHLPHEISIDGGRRILSLRWRAVANSADEVEQIILLVRDETVQKELERRLAKEKAEKFRSVEKIFEIMGPQSSRVNEFIQSMESRLAVWNSQNKADANWVGFARDLHTVKGEARTLGLKGLAAQTHALESEIDVLQNQLKNSAGFAEAWQLWQAEVHEYLTLCRDYLQRKAPELRSQARDLIHLVGEALQGLRPYLEEHRLSFSSLVLTDKVVALPSQLARDIKTVLLHAVTNSIDHGFVLPRRQGGFDRSQIELEFSLTEHNGLMRLTIADNGAGLNRKALGKIVERSGQTLESVKIDDIVFLPGVSTAEQASEISGRGVGLSAIKAVAEKLGGEVSLRDNADCGTMLTLEWTAAELCHSA